jgi:hypothetical protein
MKTRSSIIGAGVIAVAALAVAACGSSGSGSPGKLTDADGGAGAPGSGAGPSAGGATSTGGGNSAGGSSAGASSAGGSTSAGGGTGIGGLIGIAGTTGSGGVTSMGPVGLGSPCLTAKDCLTGFTCLGPTSTELDGGGIANGLCTIDCSADITAAATDLSACSPAGVNAICLQVSDTKAYCVESCNLGPLTAAQTKCHNRSDMACALPDGAPSGYCKPTCRGDFDCAGRTCDLAEGTCTGGIAATRKLPLGTKCDPNVDPANDTCEGACVGVLDTNATTTMVGFCSGFCTLGEIGCGVDPNSTAPLSALCLFGTDTQSDVGDLGFCAELCDCNDDCTNKDFLCTEVMGLQAQLGRVGACGPPSSAPADAAAGIACK